MKRREDKLLRNSVEEGRLPRRLPQAGLEASLVSQGISLRAKDEGKVCNEPFASPSLKFPDPLT